MFIIVATYIRVAIINISCPGYYWNLCILWCSNFLYCCIKNSKLLSNIYPLQVQNIFSVFYQNQPIGALAVPDVDLVSHSLFEEQDFLMVPLVLESQQVLDTTLPSVRSIGDGLQVPSSIAPQQVLI